MKINVIPAMGLRRKETFVQQQFLKLSPDWFMRLFVFNFWALVNGVFSLLMEYWHPVIYNWLKASVWREDYLSLDRDWGLDRIKEFA